MKIRVDDLVRKTSGDYWWRGVVCAVFTTPDGHERVVVAHPVEKGYVLHIYAPANLQIWIDDEFHRVN